MPSHADEIVYGIIGKWSAGFRKLDAEALASLYSREAFFFGSNPNLYRGRKSIAAYFNGLPRWETPSVQFGDVRIAKVSSELINMAGKASFFLDGEASALSVKITWTIVREDGDWKIASHHVSSYTPLIER
ncbi:MAG: nuclear transport factor 2 family protein [Bradyrhizobium sp.]|uniref:YybH family protein n=1 Tax=Bradyrhizobium sp. TaxID=376 RepID=UPI0025C5CA35|nr:nuclear transport factor 2 family protein [Bradyrhizobium sp.]MBI5262026.1 nuclear transport factor 2 family protein [Bradyrhizobium sp.]